MNAGLRILIKKIKLVSLVNFTTYFILHTLKKPKSSLKLYFYFYIITGTNSVFIYKYKVIQDNIARAN